MAEGSKKRSGSFKKFFPSIFFNKSKDKNKDHGYKNSTNTPKSNQYHDPRSMIRSDKYESDDNTERIYENLTTNQHCSSDAQSIDISSNNSSSSTLVSVTVKNKQQPYKVISEQCLNPHTARPQVPPRPYYEMHSPNHSKAFEHPAEFSDVYYHSLEKLTDKISPIDEIEIYRASQIQANPASVGAEIKRVSTKFLISPKKEAEVRTIQPTRARSLSFDQNDDNVTKPQARPAQKIEKAYNYSAPTSPLPINHKIPNMPKTASPYEHVRKNMIEAEEKRNNSLSRNSFRQTTSPVLHSVVSSRTMSPSTSKESTLDREQTRKKVEAFYWQKLKEMKEKEDDYYMRHSSLQSPGHFRQATSTPTTHLIATRCTSLPRGTDLQTYINQPIYSQFIRNAPERRTDTFIKGRRAPIEPGVVLRHPEKISAGVSTRPIQKPPTVERGSLNRQTNTLSQQKRVSFEEQLSKPKSVVSTKVTNDINKTVNKGNEWPTNTKVSEMLRGPPRPPVRTTSVSSKSLKVVNNKGIIHLAGAGHSVYSESESGSEAGEIQRILQSNAQKEEDWHGDGRMDGGMSDGETGRGLSRNRSSRRDDPRRHTLAGANHLYVHPHHAAHNAHDLENCRVSGPPVTPEYATVNKQREMRPNKMFDPILRKPPLPRGYPPHSNGLLFDDDPGIMSEVETSSTGFRRGGKQRSSLPVVRTPSKTLERPLGLVFLQYRNETKRALLPNEITSIDTVKALFVRSFPKQLTMQYMDSPLVKIYIHDSSKDMFYELEDDRAHLRDIRDRSVLRLFESTDIGGGAFPGAVGVGSLAMPPTMPSAACSGPSSWDQDQNYFSEPEIDSDYHKHKAKVKAPAYYIGNQAPSTLPRGGPILRAFSPAAAPVPADRVKNLPAGGHAEGYMSSPERGAARAPYEDPYYTQFLGPAGARSNITPVIDEEASEAVIIEDGYQLYGAMTGANRPLPRSPFDNRVPPQVEELQRLRVEKMERQLANLTGLVKQALAVPPGTTGPLPTVAPRQDPPAYGRSGQDAARFATNERPPKLGRDKFQKSVSFEKSVSFSDDPPDMNSPKQHSPQHSADTKPTKPAIKSSTLPRTSSQERDRMKPAPPPKPAGLSSQQIALAGPQRTYTINVTPEFFHQLRDLQKQSRDLRIETRNLRRSTLAHAIQMRQMMAESIIKLGALAEAFCNHDPESQLSREEEGYRQDMLLLENDLYELEATVERLRGQAANRYKETRVNMADIERIAMVLSKSSKTVADWKLKFPTLQESLKTKLAAEMEKVVRKEKMLEEEPERLELALRRCKKLTGTLVTLKRLACVQEQRLPITDGRVSPGSSQSSLVLTGPAEETSLEINCNQNHNHNKGGGGRARGAELRPENALDALLDELQTFAKPGERGERAEQGESEREPPLRRLHSYPSGSDTDASPPVRARGHHPTKPPVPERHPELLALAARRAPPPPPPRTTSRSPLASPTSPASPCDPDDKPGPQRQALLEHRHQELLKKQKALQEQYARLQMIQRSGNALPPNSQPDLKKTGSESNLLTKMNLNMAPASISGSMTHLAGDAARTSLDGPEKAALAKDAGAVTNKVYETDIL